MASVPQRPRSPNAALLRPGIRATWQQPAVARTTCDLAGEEKTEQAHQAEALTYRPGLGLP